MKRHTRSRPLADISAEVPNKLITESKKFKLLSGRAKGRWARGAHLESWKTLLSESDEDTDDDFSKKRATLHDYFSDLLKALPHQRYSLFARVKAHPKTPATEVSSSKRKLSISGCLFIPGTTLVASSAANSIAITDFSTGQLLRLCSDPYEESEKGEERNIVSLVLCPSSAGAVLAAGAQSGNVHLLLVSPSDTKWVADWSAHRRTVCSLGFVPGTAAKASSHLHLLRYYGMCVENRARLWLESHVRIGALTQAKSRCSLLARYHDGCSVASLSISPDGSKFFTTSGRLWKLVVAETPGKVEEYLSQSDMAIYQESEDIAEVCFLSDTRLAYITAGDERLLKVEQWVAARKTLKMVATCPLTEERRRDAWQPWRRLSTYTAGAVQYLVCGGKDGSVMFFNVDNAASTKTLEVSFRLCHPQLLRPVIVVAVHPDRQYVVAGNSKNVIAIWKWQPPIVTAPVDGAVRVIKVDVNATVVEKQALVELQSADSKSTLVLATRSGRVTKIHVIIGADVKAGESLLLLESEPGT